MLRERQKLITNVHKTLDIGLTVLAFIAAYFIKKNLIPAPFSGLTLAPNYHAVLLMIIIIWFLTLSSFRLYVSYRRRTYAEIFWNMVKAVATATGLLFAVMYLFKITDVSRLLVGIFFLLNIGLLAASKRIVYRTLNRYRKKGFNFRNVVIVGSRERAKDVIDAIGDQLGAGFRVLGCLETDPGRVGADVKNGICIIETVDAFKKILNEHVVDEVIFAMPLKMITSAEEHIALAEEMGVPVRIIPDWQIHCLMHQPVKACINFEDFLGIPSMTLTATPLAEVALLLKSTFDITLAGIVFLFFLPQFIVIACVVKIVSPGPIFF